MNLPDKTQLPVPKIGQLALRELANVLMTEVYRTLRRPVQTAEQVQQSALARARLAHQRQPLAARDIEVETGENDQLRAAGAVGFGKSRGADGNLVRNKHGLNIILSSGQRLRGVPR